MPMVFVASSSLSWSIDIFWMASSEDFSFLCLGTAPFKASKSLSSLYIKMLNQKKVQQTTHLKLISLSLSKSRGPVLSHSGLLWLDETPFCLSLSFMRSLKGDVVPRKLLLAVVSLLGEPLLKAKSFKGSSPKASKIWLSNCPACFNSSKWIFSISFLSWSFCDSNSSLLRL